MQNLPTPTWLLTALVIASQGTACGSVRTGAGSTSGNGGSETDWPGLTGGSGGLPSSGGSPTAGGSTASEGGSEILAGSAGMAGIAGAGSATGGAAGGTAGGGTGGAAEDANKIILFDGSKESFNNWVSTRNGGANPWTDNGDGTMTVKGSTGDIQSEQRFQNVFVHLEYMTPKLSFSGGGQEQGNSGVLLNGSYELQILAPDAFTDGLLPTEATCGAVYGFAAPLEVACYEEEVWNTYEIEFQAPTCDVEYPTLVVTPARFVEAKLNGKLIHRNVDVPRKTTAGQNESCEPRGLLLQDWSSILPVSFRNIWAIPRN